MYLSLCALNEKKNRKKKNWKKKVMNPLDAQCNRQRNDAICVSQLKSALEIDRGLLAEKPDVKIFLPFRFYLYRPEELFQPNTYNRFLGKSVNAFV